jgi:hypothetical protein
MKKQFDIYIPEICVQVGKNMVAVKPAGIIAIMDLKDKPFPLRYPDRKIDLKNKVSAIFQSPWYKFK